MNGSRHDDWDWNLLRSFAAVAEAGSLSGAARLLGASQPTLGRHIALLEEQVGQSLFGRHARGLALTERGTQLYAAAVAVRERVDAFSRQAAGLSESLTGTVRVSASEIVTYFVLPDWVARLREDEPGVQLELVADNRPANLLRRDADVAVRMFRPEQDDLIARKVADSHLGLYASRRYLDRVGVPQSRAELLDLDVMGLDRDTLHLQAVAALGLKASRGDFPIRTDAQPFHIHACVAGAGIAGIQNVLAVRFPDLVRVLPDVRLGVLPIWLVAHADLRRSARVRYVFDSLAAHLVEVYSPPP